MTIKIILIDDHTLFRSGIKALLSRQSDFEVIGEAADGLSGVKMAEQLKPDVVLLDFLLKNINADFLLDSIRKAVDGDNVFSPEMTTRLVQSLISPSAPRTDQALSTLTPRELEILGYLAAGHSNKVIARHLDLAESTVKVHVQNLLRKLNLSSRVQAAVYAVQHKVPQPEIN